MKLAADTTTDDVDGRILDAAYERFAEVGVKKTTIEDVARHAGVDRVTIYRRVGSRDDLVQAVLGREVTRVLAELAAITQRHNAIADLIADGFVTVVTRWRTHALAQRMLALEPERVVMKLTVDGGSLFTMSVAATASTFATAVERGLLAPTPDLQARAEIICRIVHSLILAPHGLVDLDTDEQLDAFARRYLVPVVAGTTTTSAVGPRP